MPNEKTPMEQLISDLRQLPEPDNRFTRKIIEAIILKAESYLPSERKMVEDAYDAGDYNMDFRTRGSQYFDNRFGNR